MSFGLPLRLMRTASFGLALLYATLLAVSAVVLGFIVYWAVQASIDRQIGRTHRFGNGNPEGGASI